MRRFHEWLSPRKDYLVFLATVIFSLILIFSNDRHQLQTVRMWAFGGVGIILEKLSVVGELYSTFDENRWLRKRNVKLMLENCQFKEAQRENERLREMLAFKSESEYDLIPARVIGKRNDGFINSILVSVGHADSVNENMPVVTSQGIVGKLFNVGETYSTSQLLLDRNFKVSAMIARSRVTGIVNWSDGRELYLAAVPKRSDVSVGDTVVTSGYSSIFPKGLLIGTVTDVNQEVTDLFMDIEIQPEVDFSKLEEVFVIKRPQSIPMVSR